MRILLVFLGLVISSQAFAGLYDDLLNQETARSEARSRQIDANRRAYVQAVTADWLVKNLRLPQGTSVVDEGESKGTFWHDEQYRVGYEWGCGIGSRGIACINASTGQHVTFGVGPIAHASEIFDCQNFPQYFKCPGAKVRRAK